MTLTGQCQIIPMRKYNMHYNVTQPSLSNKTLVAESLTLANCNLHAHIVVGR